VGGGGVRGVKPPILSSLSHASLARFRNVLISNHSKYRPSVARIYSNIYFMLCIHIMYKLYIRVRGASWTHTHTHTHRGGIIPFTYMYIAHTAENKVV